MRAARRDQQTEPPVRVQREAKKERFFCLVSLVSIADIKLTYLLIATRIAIAYRSGATEYRTAYCVRARPRVASRGCHQRSEPGFVCKKLQLHFTVKGVERSEFYMQDDQARREERGDPLLVAILVSPIGTSRWPARTQAVARLRPLAATARRGAARTAERSAGWWGRAQGRGWTGTAAGRTVPPAAGRHEILGPPLEILLEIEAGWILDFLARVRNRLTGPRRAISKRRKPTVKPVNCNFHVKM